MSDPAGTTTADKGEKLVEWRINHHLFITFEADTPALEHLIPEQLEIIEVRPNVSLLSIGLLQFEAGLFGPDSPQFNEIAAMVQVAPDLSARMPTMPRMSFFDFSVYSNSREFVELDQQVIYAPVYHIPSLKVEFTPDSFGATVRDDHGPILSFRNSHPDPEFSHGEFWGYHFTNMNGLQKGISDRRGSRCEHMKPAKDFTLHDHPFFQGLDVNKVRRCYRQMMLEPGTICRERFYAMQRMDS